MIQQQGLGNARPQLMYQDIPIFRNDFISKAEAVQTEESTVAAVTSATVVELADAPTAATANHLLLRGADDGVLYRYEIASVDGVEVTVASATGSYFDPESNEFRPRRALNDAGLIQTSVTESVVAERIDGSSIYCGAFGELKGIVGFTSSNNAGLTLQYVGPRENENAYQYRMKWYVGFDLYNRLALARMDKVLGLGQ